MNATEVHLILNHVPVVLTMIGGVILFVSLTMGGMQVRNTGLVLLALAAAATIPVFLTGEGAEETVEQLGIAESIVEKHEEVAEVALFIMQAMGILAVLSMLLAKRKPVARYLSMATIVASFFAFGFIARAAHLGGQIRHTEIAGAVADGAGVQEGEQGERDSDD